MRAQIALARKTNKKVAIKLAGFVSAIALLTAGCATTPQAPPSVNQVQAHSILQIKQAIRADKLSQVCATVSKNKHSQAESLYTQWQSEYWPQVVGADNHYRSILSDKTLSFEGQTLSMEALKLYADEVEASNARFSYLARIKTDPSRICLRKMQETLTSLETPDNIKASLIALAKAHPQPPAAGDRVPSLAGDFTIDSKTGRSHYQVEQAAKTMSCATPKIITFKNQWPTEIYGAFCSDDHQLISCEWGKCKTL